MCSDARSKQRNRKSDLNLTVSSSISASQAVKARRVSPGQSAWPLSPKERQGSAMAWALARTRDQGAHGPGTGGDVQELVAVEMGEPFGGAGTQMLHGAQDAAFLGHAFGARVRQVVKRARLCQPIHEKIGAIGAVIGADHDGPEADDPVIGEPFEDMDPLVPHTTDKGHGCRGHRLGPVIRRRPRVAAGPGW